MIQSRESAYKIYSRCLSGNGVLPRTGLKVIKLVHSDRLKIKCNDWLLADTIIALYFEFETETILSLSWQIIALYFEFETVLKFYNLEAKI